MVYVVVSACDMLSPVRGWWIHRRIPARYGISIQNLRPTLSNVYMPLGKAAMAYRDYSLQALDAGSAAHTGCQYCALIYKGVCLVSFMGVGE
jgi:hypothetical protein